MGVNPDRVEQVFSAAVAKGSPAERVAYVRGACGGDAVLRDRVEALLASHDASDGFLPRAPHPQAVPTADHGPQPESAGARIGRYRLLQLIGEGGFGSVFMAEQEHPVRRRVALKIIKPGMDSAQVVARFEAERQALAMMDHPNIARVFDAGATDAGRPFFVMELVNGIPITEYCDKNNFPTRDRLGLFVLVCQAVQHAHHKGIIHRDIKPSNVLVTLHDGVPVPKVIDFGIAKATQSRLTEKTLFTEFRQMIGTPEYMSPEQAEMSGLDVDTRSDVFSLGVLLYELLTGTTPFDPKDLRSKAYAEIQRMIREVEPPKPSTRVCSLGGTLAAVAAHRRTEPRKLGQLMRGELDCIVMKAMEKDRTRRYETASGLSADVRRYLDNEPILARPATAGYRLRKLTRKYKVGIAAGAAVFASLVVGLAGATAGLMRARAERDRAVSLRLAAEVARDDANEAAAFIRDFSIEPRDPASTIRRARETARRLDGGWLRDQPEAAAICRTVIGVAMTAGATEDAERQLAAALDLCRGADGHYHPEAGTVLSYMGNAQFAKKDYAAAVRYYQHALDVLGRLPEAPGNKEVTLSNLAAALDRLGRHDDIRKLRPELVAARLHVLGEQIARDPTDPAPLAERANLYMAEGDFRAAAADCGAFLAQRPDDSELALRHCALLLYAGQENAYRDARQAMLARFGASGKIEDRERAAKAHFISPDPGPGAARLAEFVDEAADARAHSFIAWFQMTKALAEYRAGHYQAAAEWCERAGGFPNPSAHATLMLLAGMSRYRATGGADALAQLERAMEAAESLNRPQDADNYAIAMLLLKEAKALRASAPSVPTTATRAAGIPPDAARARPNENPSSQ